MRIRIKAVHRTTARTTILLHPATPFFASREDTIIEVLAAEPRISIRVLEKERPQDAMLAGHQLLSRC